MFEKLHNGNFFGGTWFVSIIDILFVCVQPMPRSFAFTASHEFGELQLGGYDPESIDPSDTMRMFKMVRDDYGVKVRTFWRKIFSTLVPNFSLLFGFMTATQLVLIPW